MKTTLFLVQVRKFEPDADKKDLQKWQTVTFYHNQRGFFLSRRNAVLALREMREINFLMAMRNAEEKMEFQVVSIKYNPPTVNSELKPEP